MFTARLPALALITSVFSSPKKTNGLSAVTARLERLMWLSDLHYKTVYFFFLSVGSFLIANLAVGRWTLKGSTFCSSLGIRLCIIKYCPSHLTFHIRFSISGTWKEHGMWWPLASRFEERILFRFIIFCAQKIVFHTWKYTKVFKATSLYCSF